MLIAIEGIDAAGKNTQTDLLVQRMKNSGLRATAMSFPRYKETFFGKQIGEFLRGKFGDLNDARLVGLLFAGDRLQSLPTILESLVTHDVVVTDRYVGSNLAYQGASAGDEARPGVIEWLASVEYEVYGLPRADINVLLDMPVEIAAERILKRSNVGGRVHRDVYESDLAYLSKCRDAYGLIASKDPSWETVPVVEDGQVLSSQVIAERIWRAVLDRRPQNDSSPSLAACLSAAKKPITSRR